MITDKINQKKNVWEKKEREGGSREGERGGDLILSRKAMVDFTREARDTRA